MVGTESGHQRADRLQPQSQTTSQSSHGPQPCLLNETVSHAVWGHPGWTGHGGQF